jgi:energy-coupling factor transport system substrate-specific component
MATQAHHLTSTQATLHKDWYGTFLLLVVNIIGLVAFLTPFFGQIQQREDASDSRAGEAVLLLVGLIFVCLVVLFAQLGRSLNTRAIALLAVLIAVNSILRMVDLLLPLPGGFSPMFLLIILTGYAYGAQIGFLMGALSLFGSALATGGIGPWLPFQMFTAGWIGLFAGWLPHLKAERWTLPLVGAFFGILYGFIINLYSWPFIAGAAQQSWQVGLSASDGVARYLIFYAVTSLWWDIFAAIGNFVLLFALGPSLLQALRRFQAKFFVEIE